MNGFHGSTGKTLAIRATGHKSHNGSCGYLGKCRRIDEQRHQEIHTDFSHNHLDFCSGKDAY
jgi:hypothetical protein